MITAFHELRHWLRSKNIEVEGVRVVIEFPNEMSMRHAQCDLFRDFRADAFSPQATFGQADTIVGIPFKLTYPCLCGGRHA